MFGDRYRNNWSIPPNLNSLLRHKLDSFSETGNYLHFSDLLLMNHDISIRSMLYSEALLSSDALVKFVQIAIDSCCVIQDQLNHETKPGCVQEMISAMAQTLIIVRALILLMIKRSDRNIDKERNANGKNFKESKDKINDSIAKILVEEVLNRCPTVSAPFYGYSSPVANILFNIRYKPLLYSHLTEQCFSHNYTFMMMIVQSQCDFNAPDSLGNTVLHNVICDVLQEIDFFYNSRGDNRTTLADLAFEIVKLLLEKGSYPHAKNKDGKRPFDGITEDKFHRMNRKDINVRFKDLMTKYDFTLTLKFLAATKIADLKIPYRNLLPDALVKFVDLH